MAAPSPHPAQFDDPLARTPALARQLVDQVQASLRAPSVNTSSAPDHKLMAQIAKALHIRRNLFESALAAHMQSAIRAAGEPDQAGRHLDHMRLDQFPLIDEDQAEKEIEIARTVQCIELKAERELRELNSFSASMPGEPNSPLQANPFRPAIYAQGLSAAVRELPLTPNERNMLLRISGRALADLLRPQYAQACERLRQAGVKPQAFNGVSTPRRPRASDVDVSQADSLQILLKRLPASMQTTDQHGFALLNILFAQMRADEDVQPAIKAMIGPLQPALMRVARLDPDILSSAQHPAWHLINQLASCADGYAETDATALTNFLHFIGPRIQQLVPAPGPTTEQLQNTLEDVQRFVEQQSQWQWQAQLQAVPQAVAQWQEADQRLALRPVLRQQIEQQLEGSRIKSSIKDFLLGTWVDVLTHALASKDDDGTHAMAATVDDLIRSLQRPSTLAERDALKHALPGLVNRLQRGMDSIALPRDRQEAFLRELMGIHGHHLLLMPKASAPAASEPSPADLVQQMRDDMKAHRADKSSGDRASKIVDTNIGTVPTVPMRYDDDHDELDNHPHGDTPAEWTQSLRKGMWCKLHLQGRLATVQLLWISDNRQFFMFIGDKAIGVQAMSRRALERLCGEGLATGLEDRSLMQRAVDSMLQGLDD